MRTFARYVGIAGGLGFVIALMAPRKSALSVGERVKVGDRFEADLSGWTTKNNDIHPELNGLSNQRFLAIAATVEGVPYTVVGQHEPSGVILNIPARLITRKL